MKILVIILLISNTMLPGRVSGQIRGESILASPNGNTNTITLSSVSSGATNAISDSRVNAKDGDLVSFDKLGGFPISLTDELVCNTNRPAWADAQINTMIPVDIRALDQHSSSVEGFMTPVQFEKGKVTEFILARYPPACCYGTIPQIHEWIKVHVPLPGVEATDYNVVRAHGVLHVGAERVAGTLTSVYRMDANAVDIAPAK